MSRAETPSPDVLLVTGTVGVGKGTVADAVARLLADRGIAHALVDLDQIRLLWPPPESDRFNLAVELRNLAALAANYRAAGAQRLVLAGVIERGADRVAYEQACGGRLCVVRLCGELSLIQRRLRERHRDDAGQRAWHLERCLELDAILDQACVSDADVDIGGRTPLQIAADVVSLALW
jgi:hypothetical protein